MAFQLFQGTLVENAKDRLAEIFSWSAFGGVFQDLLQDLMQAAALELEKSGAEKKQMVLDGLAGFLDTVPLPTWAVFFRRWIKAGLLVLADGIIDAVYLKFKEQINHE
ncbi:hypothetical protein [Bremerella cremea]|uniref:hypothetical protein n=1 Tax=Bremerella cremea TaxID=1031537 RepID=UPI0031E9EBEF